MALPLTLVITPPPGGYADLAATGMLTPELAEGGLDDVIAFILRGCAPDARAWLVEDANME